MIKLKNSKKLIFIYMVLLAYLKPYNITLIPSINAIFKLLKVVVTLVLILEFINKKMVLHKAYVYLMCFCTVWAVSLFLNNAPKELLNNILSVIGTTLFFENNYYSEYFKKTLLKALYSISACFIVLNFITVLIGHPFFAADMNLGDNANFLGGDNYSAFILITHVGFMFFENIYSKGKISAVTWFFAVIPLLGLLITFSFTGIIAYTLLLIAVRIKNASVKYTFFNYKLAFVICLVFLIGISYLHFDVLASFLLNKVDKVGFNGRIWIWPMSVSAIMKKPLFGYGAVSAELAQTWFIAGANHTHNILLEFPFSTGLIGSTFLVLYLKEVLNNAKRMYYKPETQVLLLTLFAYIVCSTFDFYIGMINLYLLLNMIFLYKNENDYKNLDQLLELQHNSSLDFIKSTDVYIWYAWV